MRLLVLASLALVLNALSCDRPPMGARPPGFGPQGAPKAAAGPQAAAPASGSKACDPAKCSDFCSPARCLFSNTGSDAECMATCEARCGDGLFDDQDAAVIACTIDRGHDLECAGPKACCEQQLNTQVCAQ